MSAAVLPVPVTDRRGLRLRGVDWLVWRQNRVAFLVVTLMYLGAIGYLLYTRDQLDVMNARWHALHCGPDTGALSEECIRAESAVWQSTADWQNVGLLLFGFPGLLGAVMAAQPLAADLEHGRHLLLWSQSVSPRRWLAQRLAQPALLLFVLSTALGVTVRWVGFWSHPQRPGGYWSRTDGVHDLVPVYPALTLAAFALGVLVGLWVRRVLPAFGVTVGLYAALAFVVEKVHPFLLPLHRRVFGQAIPVGDGAAVYDNGPVLNGRDADFSQCPDGGCGNVPMWQRYHPASEFSPMLWIEAGLLTVVACALLALAYRRLRALAR